MKRVSQTSLFFSLVFFLGFLGARIILGEIFPFMYGLIIASLILAIANFVLDWEFYKKFFSSTSIRAFRLVGLRLFVVLIVFLMGLQILNKLSISWDLSSSKINSLSDETLDYLHQQKEQTNIFGFFQKADDPLLRDSFEKLCSLFNKASSVLDCQLVDPSFRPDLTEKYLVKTSPGIVISSNEKTIKIDQWSEEKILNAMSRLKNKIEKRLCFSQQNSEVPLTSEDDFNLSFLTDSLKDFGVNIVGIDSFSEDSVRDCDAISIVGPVIEFSKESVSFLESYLKRGGNLFLGIDPGRKHKLNIFLKSYGIRFINDYVIDLSAQELGLNPANALGVVWNPTSDLSKAFSSSSTIVLPVASRFELEDSKNWLSQVLVSTNQASFTKAVLSEKMMFNPGIDSEGEMSLAILTQNRDLKAKMIVVGDSDFLTNRFFSMKQNRAFAFEIFDFLLKSDEEYSLKAKSMYRDVFIFTPNKAKLYLIFFVLPFGFLFFSLSLWVWLKRRQER